MNDQMNILVVEAVRKCFTDHAVDILDHDTIIGDGQEWDINMLNVFGPSFSDSFYVETDTIDLDTMEAIMKGVDLVCATLSAKEGDYRAFFDAPPVCYLCEDEFDVEFHVVLD